MYWTNKLHLETLGPILIPVLPADGPKEGECIIPTEPSGGGHICNAWAEEDAKLASCSICVGSGGAHKNSIKFFPA